MGVHLLKEVLDTRYYYVSIDKDFTHVLHTIRALQTDPNFEYFAGNAAQKALFEDVRSGNDIVLDLNDTRITSDCTSRINSAIQQGIRFIDSKNPRRNIILEENMRRMVKPETIPLPVYKPTEDPIQYMKALQLGVVYSLPVSLSRIDIAMIILISMTRPKVVFTLDNIHGIVLDTVAEVITISILTNYTEFYYHSPEGIEILQLVDGKLDTQRRGKCSIAQACEAGSLVPTAFGNEKLVNNTLWEPLVNVCLGAINASHQSRPKTLYEVLKGENV